MNDPRALYLICEGETDASILHTLMDCKSFQKVYHIPAGGYDNMPSVARTIRLMKTPMESDDRIIIAFDADSSNEQIRNDRIATMRYLTFADYDKRVGVFCFTPTIEEYLFPLNYQSLKDDKNQLVLSLKKNLPELREMEVIKDMQAFLDKKNESFGK